jgi:3-methyladenine DNA glycosylase AlkC
MNKTSQLIEAVISFSLEYVKDLEKIHKLKKIINSYLSNLYNYENTYSKDILSDKTKHDKNNHPHFHFLIIPAYKKLRNIKHEDKS